MVPVLAELDETPTSTGPYRWVEKDRAIYVYDREHGRCVAFARRRVADKRWEIKLAGPGHLVHEAEHRGRARGRLRRLLAGLDGAA